MNTGMNLWWVGVGFLAAQACLGAEAELDWIRVDPSGKGFVKEASGAPFVPWGFNYDHDQEGQLLEDYWEKEWGRVEEDFREMKQLGANVVRVHLQLGRFMRSKEEADPAALDRLAKLLELAEAERLYLDLTGLGCYHKADVPAWYDALGEQGRWQVQSRFWRAVAGRCRQSPAVFCYDLMNEPVVPGQRGRRDDWLGAAFAGKHFVQFIALESGVRSRGQIASSWMNQLVASIRSVDSRHLITVGLVSWSLNRPGQLSSGFTPELAAEQLDFVSVHLYPERDRLKENLDTLRAFAVGKPLVIEETFPLKCSLTQFDQFWGASREIASGWMGFYWGQTPAELEQAGTIQAGLMLGWLRFFSEQAEVAQESVVPSDPP